VQLRHADAGSCQGCELEIASASGRVYDAERAGARPTAPPRHADGVLATGLVKRNLAVPLARTTEAVPRQVVAQALRLRRVVRALVSGAGNRAAGRDPSPGERGDLAQPVRRGLRRGGCRRARPRAAIRWLVVAGPSW